MRENGHAKISLTSLLKSVKLYNFVFVGGNVEIMYIFLLKFQAIIWEIGKNSQRAAFCHTLYYFT